MKLSIRDDSKNYTCTVVKLPVKQKVEGLDKLVKVTVFGNDVLTKKDADENLLYLFFPAECSISETYLSHNNEFRDSTFNKDKSQKGYFESNGRVKAIKFKGVISTGYLAPLNTIKNDLSIKGVDFTKLKEGDEFTDIDGYNVCKKYKVVHSHATAGQTKESRYNKKLKRFNKLVANQFRFHVDTSQLAKNLHMFHPEDIIVITDKWHGTSAVFSNLLVNKELTWKEKVAKWLGLDIVSTYYDNLYSSRSVIKNQYINKEATAGFYNEDIWKVVDDEVKSKIEPGISLYGEIVGYLPSGKHIQKGYDYGCETKNIPDLPKEGEVVKGSEIRPIAQHKFVVYRITYTKPDGNVIEFSWQQIKDYCKKYELEHVKELYFGVMDPQFYREVGIPLFGDTNFLREKLQEHWFNTLCETYLEENCKWCVNKVPAEGIVVRRDGLETYSAYKLKAKRFLERETKMLDKGEENIEDEGAATDNL